MTDHYLYTKSQRCQHLRGGVPQQGEVTSDAIGQRHFPARREKEGEMLGKGTAPIQGFVVLKALEVASTDLLGAISYLPNLLRGASGLLRVRGVVLWGGRGCSPGDLPGCAGLLRLLLLRLLLLLRVLLLTWIRILDVRTGPGVMPLVVLRVLGILAVFVFLVARGIVHQHRVVAVLWVLILVVMLVLLVLVVVL